MGRIHQDSSEYRKVEGKSETPLRENGNHQKKNQFFCHNTKLWMLALLEDAHKIKCQPFNYAILRSFGLNSFQTP